MAISLHRALEMLGRATGLFASGTSSGSGSTTAMQDAVDIYRHDVNTLKNKWLYMRTGSAANEARRISSIHASDGTVTVDAAFGGSTGSGSTY